MHTALRGWKAEVLPGDLSDGGLVQADWRGEVWLRSVNGQTGHVLFVARPTLLHLRKTQSELIIIIIFHVIVSNWN